MRNHGTIAQLVEQWLEAPCVAGSTPARTISGIFSQIIYVNIDYTLFFICYSTS